ncbi:MAG: D-alanine--D-alanine ligase [Planctomycetales bacterium]|nr:D-alanine--D-alanine ligase [Planctomycetales bacterium]
MNYELRNKNLKIAVLAGGIGSERAISLLSGQTVYQALQEAGVAAVLADITPEDMSILDDGSIDVFFPILHGQFGEDGQLQQILEERRLRFTGSGSESSRKAFDKLLSKQVFFQAGLPVAKHIIVHSGDTVLDLKRLLQKLASKFVVKPLRQGSSVGITITDSVETAAVKALDCFRQYGDCMVEEFIAGREITVGILNGTALPLIEIRSKAAFYDYQAKYESDDTEYLFDTVGDAALVNRTQQLAVACFNELGCRHLSRVDFILTDDGRPVILEINTLPGFTSHSLLPMAAARAGIAKPQLCRQIVEAVWNEDHASITVKE